MELGRTPYNPSVTEIFGKGGIGLGISIFLSIGVFIVYILSKNMFERAIQHIEGINSVNPMIGIIFAGIGFITGLIGTLIIGAIYNSIWSDKYYDIGKIIINSFVINFSLSIFSSITYILYFNNIEILFLILILHIGFSTYITLLSYDIISNPNYSSVYLISNSISFFISIFLVGLIFKLVNLQSNPSHIGYLLTIPIILFYTFIPFFSSAFEKLYYKFYEQGNNFLYTPSIEEILVDQEELEEANIE